MERTTGNGHHQLMHAGSLPGELAESLDHAREQLGDMNRKALVFIQKRPIPVLIGAFCVGILLGRIASRI